MYLEEPTRPGNLTFISMPRCCIPTCPSFKTHKHQTWSYHDESLERYIYPVLGLNKWLIFPVKGDDGGSEKE